MSTNNGSMTFEFNRQRLGGGEKTTIPKLKIDQKKIEPKKKEIAINDLKQQQETYILSKLYTDKRLQTLFKQQSDLSIDAIIQFTQFIAKLRYTIDLEVAQKLPEKLITIKLNSTNQKDEEDDEEEDEEEIIAENDRLAKISKRHLIDLFKSIEQKYQSQFKKLYDDFVNKNYGMTLFSKELKACLDVQNQQYCELTQLSARTVTDSPMIQYNSRISTDSESSNTNHTPVDNAISDLKASVEAPIISDHSHGFLLSTFEEIVSEINSNLIDFMQTPEARILLKENEIYASLLAKILNYKIPSGSCLCCQTIDAEQIKENLRTLQEHITLFFNKGTINTSSINAEIKIALELHKALVHETQSANKMKDLLALALHETLISLERLYIPSPTQMRTPPATYSKRTYRAPSVIN